MINNISKYKNNLEYSALHLKAKFQESKYIDIMLNILKKFKNIENKIFIFDIKIETAKYIKLKNNNIKLFPSIAHEYDILRYNQYTWWTLISINNFLDNKNLFDWVWLDEWDRKNKNWKKKL